MVNNCEGCLQKQRKIDQLLEEVQRLKAKLRYQERKDKEGFFGSSTPSSQLPLKANTDQENKNHKGGARPGHTGHGRKAHSEETAVMHYFHGIPMGRICEMTDIPLGSLVDMFHRLSGYFAPVMDLLKEQYRFSAVKHADETGWRNDGQSGYAWLFCTPDTSLFSFQNTRSASVPRSIFGDKKPPGVLVVDRYNAYNKAPVQIQYCYAHLLRDVEKLEKDSRDSQEIKSFVSILASLLSQAMHLRSQPLSDEQYYRQAKEIQKKIMEVNYGPAQHLAIQAMQDLFNPNEHRLYHWVQDRRVPPDNNLAERDLRPTVIARKVSFGSSSDAGSKTRSVLMSVLHTLHKRRGDQSLDSIFKNLLDELAKNPKVQIASFFPQSKSIPHN